MLGRQIDHEPAQSDRRGVFCPSRILEGRRTDGAEIAGTLGLGRDVLSRKNGVRTVKTQTSLREMVEIPNRVEPQTNSALAANVWFRSEPLGRVA